MQNSRKRKKSYYKRLFIYATSYTFYLKIWLISPTDRHFFSHFLHFLFFCSFFRGNVCQPQTPHFEWWIFAHIWFILFAPSEKKSDQFCINQEWMVCVNVLICVEHFLCDGEPYFEKKKWISKSNFCSNRL